MIHYICVNDWQLTQTVTALIKVQMIDLKYT